MSLRYYQLSHDRYHNDTHERVGGGVDRASGYPPLQDR